MGLGYTFEKMYSDDPEKQYQVRLNGEFVMYMDRKDSAVADEILSDAGFNSRQEVLDYVVEKRLKESE